MTLLNTKRSLAGAALTLPALLLTATRAGTAAAQPATTTRNPGHYAMRFGDDVLVALNDGFRPSDYYARLTGITQERALEIGARHFQPPEQPISTNAYLLDTGDRRILIDTGAGTLLDPRLGHLPISLEAAGYKPEAITDVVLTHIHVDHIGGLMRGPWRAFPKATVHVGRREAEYWLSPEERERADAALRPGFDAGVAMLAPYREAGRLNVVGEDTEFLPGFRFLLRPGHTPGHVEVRVTRGERSIAFLGDLMHSQQVQFAEPDVSISYDWDKAQSATSRRAALEDAARGAWWIALCHVSFPGIGHVRQAGRGFDWYPAMFGQDG